MQIPKNMSNDQSKVVAEIVVLERELSIIQAKLYSVKNYYKRMFS